MNYEDFRSNSRNDSSQILSQVRQCHLHSIEEDGCGGKVLSRLLNNAVAAGKRVRSETNISKGSVSISSAAVELSEHRCNEDLNLPFSEARLAVMVLDMLEGGNAQLASFFDRHKMGRDDPLLARPSSNIPPPSNRYETKAAHFYRRHLAKHAAELAGEAGCYRGREASRAGSKESKDSKQAASDSESGSPDRLRRMTRRR